MKKEILFGLATLLVAVGCASKSKTEAEAPKATSEGLNAKLAQMSEASAGKMPPAAKAVMEKAEADLKAKKIEEKALKVGDKMPAFTLNNAKGKKVSLASLLQKGPVVITFYRGGWCPYCNEQLQTYQKHLGDFQKSGAQLVAISPDSPKSSQDLTSAKDIEFEVLSDSGNKVAQKSGIAFKVDEDLKGLYLKFGIDLEKSQGQKGWELPVPATYVVNRLGIITYAYVNIDYKQRAEPKDILEALNKL